VNTHTQVRGDVGVQVVAQFVSDLGRQRHGAVSCLGRRRRQSALLPSVLVRLALDVHASVQQVNAAFRRSLYSLGVSALKLST
jgi:hypothetical protein